MSFGGPYSALNKRMQEFREENNQRREKRNRYRETAGISTASADHYASKKSFSEQDRRAFLKELKAEQFNNKVKTAVAILLSLAIGAGIVWALFLQ